MWTEEEEKLNEKLRERWYRLNESFVWTPRKREESHRVE